MGSIGSCEIDLTVSGVSYAVDFTSFSAGGSNAVLTAVDASNSSGEAGLQFTGAGSTNLTSFSGLGYTASIATTGQCTGAIGAYTCYIAGQYQQVSYGVLGNSSGTVTYNTDTCASIPPNSVLVLTPASSTYPATACTSNITGNDVVSMTSSLGTNTLTNIESDVYVGSSYNATTPEPTSFVLMGAGLGLVGLLGRRRKAARQ